MKFRTGRIFCPSFIVQKCTLILHNVFSEILFHFLLSNPAYRAIILFVQVHMYQGAGDCRLRGDLFIPTCNLIWIMPTEGMYTMYLIEMPPHLLFFYMTDQNTLTTCSVITDSRNSTQVWSSFFVYTMRQEVHFERRTLL